MGSFLSIIALRHEEILSKEGGIPISPPIFLRILRKSPAYHLSEPKAALQDTSFQAILSLLFHRDA